MNLIEMKKSLNNIVVNTRYLLRLAARKAGVPSYGIHQVVLRKPDLIYIPIPKNACSSIKHALYQIEFGKDFDYEFHREWGYQNIHDFYNKRADAFTSLKKVKQRDDLFRFAVVRDPVERFLSCYGNRVLELEDLKKDETKLEKLGLPVKPDLQTFIHNLDLYRKINVSIRHHTNSQSDFLGGTLSYLDKVYPIEKIDMVTNMLLKYNKNLTMRSEKSEGIKIELQEVSRDSLDRILKFYEEDYRLLHEFYSAEEVTKRFENPANK